MRLFIAVVIVIWVLILLVALPASAENPDDNRIVRLPLMGFVTDMRHNKGYKLMLKDFLIWF